MILTKKLKVPEVFTTYAHGKIAQKKACLTSGLFQVSWVRHSDTHLLTIGRLTYTSDYRFKAIHKLYSEDYLLQIKPTNHRDAGQYECQISTTPPTSHIITLAVAGILTLVTGIF